MLDFSGNLGVQFPQEPAQLPGYGDDDFVAMQSACGESFEPIVEPVLGSPGNGSDFVTLSGLPC